MKIGPSSSAVVFSVLVGLLTAFPPVVWSDQGGALFEPDAVHFAIAIDGVRQRAANEQVQRLAARAEQYRALAALLAAARAEIEAEREAMLTDHAEAVRRWAGHPPAPRPGSGWHRVNR